MNVNENNKGRRTQAERRAATRRALLDAARELFAEKGYHETSAEEIVRRAGLTRGALYHHFEDKRDLFRVVVDEMESEIDEEIEAAERAEAELPEAVMAGYRAFVDAVLDPEMKRTFFLDGPSVLGWEWREIDARHAVGKIEEGLEALIAEGYIEPQPVGPLARLINGALLEAAFFVADSDDPQTARDQVWGAMERLVGDFIRRRASTKR
ncbi:transcriptional regulator, TetR family [Rubrobacter xylanophilus DSM 9941]|uniref:Transcriptional regulator, TetR family n=1 Tax=Rubrobacter xylanophilus (strain DSM 9941 / JCM 11954 / NBRC 16129 / PRD-1) TaxID=266117 RepID=Q1AV08_RUBXD|nr:TetR/AcrR family transcriptional regulator [Rubrobacter xylanophilus]ABG04770.1 transcriptional regulator, TetR family [Rubrobacter xylanophilus DSM 9941]